MPEPLELLNKEGTCKCKIEETIDLFLNQKRDAHHAELIQYFLDEANKAALCFVKRDVGGYELHLTESEKAKKAVLDCLRREHGRPND